MTFGTTRRIRIPALFAAHPLVVLLLVALVLRLGVALFLRGPEITVSESGQTAANLVKGLGYTFDFYGYRISDPLESFMPPLYTYIVAACLRFAPDPLLTLRLIQAIISTLLTLVVYVLTRDLFGQLAAWVAGIMAAGYPIYLVLVAQPTTVIVHAALTALMILLTLRLVRRFSLRDAIAGGVVLGLNILARPAIISFVPLAIIWLWLNRPVPSKRWAATTAIFLCSAVIVVSPWVIRNVRVQGNWTFISTNGGFTFWNGNNPFTAGTGFDVDLARLDVYEGHAPGTSGSGVAVVEPYPLPREIIARLHALNESELERAFYAASFKFIRQDPSRWIELVGTRGLAFWWFRANIGTYRDFYQSSWILPYEVIYATLLVLFILGLLYARRNGRLCSLIYLLLLDTTLVGMLYQVNTRYRWEVESLYLPFAALAVTELARHLAPVWRWQHSSLQKS